MRRYLKDAVATSNAAAAGAGGAGAAQPAPQLTAVLKMLRDYVTSNGISVAAGFEQMDAGRTGYLTHAEVGRSRLIL